MSVPSVHLPTLPICPTCPISQQKLGIRASLCPTITASPQTWQAYQAHPCAAPGHLRPPRQPRCPLVLPPLSSLLISYFLPSQPEYRQLPSARDAVRGGRGVRPDSSVGHELPRRHRASAPGPPVSTPTEVFGKLSSTKFARIPKVPNTEARSEADDVMRTYIAPNTEGAAGGVGSVRAHRHCSPGA